MGEVFGERLTDPAERLIAPSMWTVVHAPTSATQAIATKAAAQSGQSHVCYGIVATIATGATAQTPINVVVLDGSTTVFSAALAAPVDGSAEISIMGLHIKGTAATSMTLQFSAAGVTASVENCTLIGYDVD